MGIAAYCVKGHLIGSITVPHRMSQRMRFAEDEASKIQRFPSFCTECGSQVHERCRACSSRIPFGAKYCGGCGCALPWTELALSAARALTDETATNLTADERSSLKSTFEDLTVDSPQTPLAVSRFQKLLAKAGAELRRMLPDIIASVATETVKKQLGL